MSLNKGAMIPKFVVDKQEQEKAQKILDVLRRQAQINRIPTSQTGGELLAYTNERLEDDPLANPHKYVKKNPFHTGDPSTKKSLCDIL